ncbi:DUF255 domain-containing protein [Haloferacaceae archaeon DSL9]
MTNANRVAWRSWDKDAFRDAEATGRPILLSLTATWCDRCHEMDARTYAEPQLAANVNDGFVPIRVDVDRNPRVRERYNMGGFPTTAFLTPSGQLLTGATYLGPEGMRQVLERVRELWTEKGTSAGRIPRALADAPTPAGDLSPRIEAHLTGQLENKYDPEFGGWGTDAKFPLPRTIEFALKREREQAVRTLDAIAAHLFDDVAGGFFRFATNRDWSDVHYEKVLDSNAALTRAFANAYLYTGDETYRDVARGTIDFLTGELWTGVAVGGSVGPGQGAAYYGLDAEERADADAPRRDFTVFAGGNALAAEALLTYAGYTDDEDAITAAERILDVLETELVDDGRVVRYRTGDETGEAGLLDDSARTVAAFTRKAQLRGEGLATARAVAERTIETRFDEGSFRDGPREGLGLLDRPLRPLDGNVEMADALIDLAVLTGEERYRDVARETIEAFADAWDRMSVQIAGYGGTAARLLSEPLVIDVGAESGTDLHRAALRVADHEKIVAPEADVAADAAVVRVGDTESDPASTPAELMAAVEALSADGNN